MDFGIRRVGGPMPLGAEGQFTLIGQAWIIGPLGDWKEPYELAVVGGGVFPLSKTEILWPAEGRVRVEGGKGIVHCSDCLKHKSDHPAPLSSGYGEQGLQDAAPAPISAGSPCHCPHTLMLPAFHQSSPLHGAAWPTPPALHAAASPSSSVTLLCTCSPAPPHPHPVA